MRINQFISVLPDDMGLLHQEVVSIYDAFVASANNDEEARTFEKMFKTEYPTLWKLKRLCESLLIGQQNTAAYERIKDPDNKRVAQIRKFKLLTKKEPPDEPA